MPKTSVYLSDEEAAALRRTAAATGFSQAELIRAGVRHVTREAGRRRFASRGSGAGPPYERPDADEIEARVRGRR